MHLEYFKSAPGVRKNTNNAMVCEETGRLPMDFVGWLLPVSLNFDLN
jgi:hypothetical protein